ncbi:GNAT family N-acetyltransferase [Puia sp. P3]|uniref:GNAT family N-acetyltransferase n=1 Tax=Puia sp. P3 TaxID=3423952 RepID=UPI003D66FC66
MPYTVPTAQPRISKKYATEYTGASFIGYFAYDQHGTPAAYYGVMPCLIQYDNRLFLSAQSGDTMTHPDHRNKGLFVRLCTLTIELARKEHIVLIFGFPNQNSAGINGKIGWTTTGNLEGFRIPVSTLPLEGLTRRIPFLQRPYKTYSKAVLGKYLLPEKGISGSAINGIYRDQAWFDYKTYSNTYVIRLGKAKAWISLGDNLTIGNIQTQEQPLGLTLYHLKKLAARLGIRNLFFHSSPGTPLHLEFAKRYQPFTSFPVLFNDLGSGIPFTS